MTQYNHTTHAPNEPQRANKGQNDGKNTASFAKVVNEILTFLFLAGMVVVMAYCQTVMP